MRKIRVILIGVILVNMILCANLFADKKEGKALSEEPRGATEVIEKYEAARQSFMFFCGYPLDKIKKESPKDPLVNDKSIPIAKK